MAKEYKDLVVGLDIGTAKIMVVVAIVALATASVTLALRDDSGTRLEREALRLSALIESARART